MTAPKSTRTSPRKNAPAGPPLPAWRQQQPPVHRPKKRHTLQQTTSVAGLPELRRVIQPTRALLLALPPLGVLLRRLAVAFGLVALGVGVWWILTADYFTVSAGQVQVRGNQRVPVETIYAAGGFDRRSIFLVQTGASARRIGQVPGIASANVRVQWPNFVLIDVKENTPWLIWQAVTQTVWLSSEGVEVPALGEAPLLTLVDAEGAARDERGGIRPDVLAAVKTLSAARPAQTRLHYGQQEGLYFAMPDGLSVYLGGGEDLASKLVFLDHLLPELAKRQPKPKSVDLRTPDFAHIK